jgi:hypothetical protein
MVAQLPLSLYYMCENLAYVVIVNFSTIFPYSVSAPLIHMEMQHLNRNSVIRPSSNEIL